MEENAGVNAERLYSLPQAARYVVIQLLLPFFSQDKGAKIKGVAIVDSVNLTTQNPIFANAERFRNCFGLCWPAAYDAERSAKKSQFGVRLNGPCPLERWL